MAAPITHIVLAEKVFDKYFAHFSREKFFVGTSFPDIRYLGVIDRDKTHFANPQLEDIQKAHDVKAGMMFHAFVDEMHGTFMRDRRLFEFTEDIVNPVGVVKLLEDEIFYNKISDWNRIASMMDLITSEELEYPIKKEDIVRWHQTFKDYFLDKPSPTTRIKFLLDTGFSKNAIQRAEEDMVKMKANDKIIKIINDFYDQF